MEKEHEECEEHEGKKHGKMHGKSDYAIKIVKSVMGNPQTPETILKRTLGKK
jgi:hypothetical protein